MAKKGTPEGQGHKTIHKDGHGVPMAEPPMHKSSLVAALMPEEDDPNYILQEKKIMQVEQLMNKGFTNITTICETLGINYKTCKAYIDRVEFRWMQRADNGNFRQLKGQARSRLEMLQQQLSQLHSNTTNPTVQGGCLRELLGVHDRFMVLDNLTPKVLERLGSDERRDANQSVEDLMNDHDRLMHLAAGFAGALEAREAVDAEFTEIP